MYHRITNETFDPWQLAVPPDSFAEQLSWLARRRTVLRLAEFADLHRHGKLPRDAVALTFDDGYACTAETAVPLLEQFQLPATIFIAADLIRNNAPFWWDEIQEIVLDHDENSLELAGTVISIGERNENDWHWKSDPQMQTPRQRAFYALWLRLRTLPYQECEEAMAQLRSVQGHSEQKRAHRLMTPAQAQSIRSKRIEFGSHAITHSSLPSLPLAEKAREIRESINACAAVTGSRPSSLAYPFGDFDAECEAVARDSGFECACTAEPRPVRHSDSVFALPRVQARDWTERQLPIALNQLYRAG
jgi:peptidoglycan/xylan/chitin deacetylase (PgdA/CDA1 family)